MEVGEKEISSKMIELDDLKRWKDSVSKALWIIFGILAGLVMKVFVEFLKLK